MSVIIKGYSKPKNCYLCLFNDSDFHCGLTGGFIDRDDWDCSVTCPIVALEEPKTGHWIEGHTDNPNIHNILCSCCFEGYPSKGHANSQYTKEKFKYCPNCGAKMAESEDKKWIKWIDMTL